MLGLERSFLPQAEQTSVISRMIRLFSRLGYEADPSEVPPSKSDAKKMS